MANYLLTVSSNGPLARDVPPPAGAVVEFKENSEAQDGLDRWSMDLVVAGSVLGWLKSAAYGEFWEFLERLLQRQEVRPQGRLTLQSRTDPHRVTLSFSYLGTHELKRGREDLSKRVAGLADPSSHHMVRDIDLTVHA